MEMTERKRLELANAKWRLYIPETDQATKTEIKGSLQKAGFVVEEETRYWQDKDRLMLSISFEAALFVRERFPNPKWKRVLIYSTSRGWSHWRGESSLPNPLVPQPGNSKLFTRKNRPPQPPTPVHFS